MCVYTEGLTRERREVRLDTEKMVKFGTFNTRNGRNGGLELALRGIAQGRVDFGVFQETNLTKGVYTRDASGF